MSHMHHVAFNSFWVSSPLIFVCGVYLRGWLRLRRPGHDSLAGWRAGSFVLGLLFIWVATASPLATLDHQTLTVHMVQHLLLMTLAPPLILLGMPVNPLAHGLSPGFVEVIGRPFRWEPIQQLGSALTHPAVCWLGAANTLLVWHIPTLFMLGLRSGVWHGIMQASFLTSGLLFWWPVFHPRSGSLLRPEWWILLYLFLASLPCDILSGFLVFCDRVVYTVFLSSSTPFGLSALEDQQCAGALMWTCVTVVYLIAGTIFTACLLSPHRSEEQSILRFEPQRVSVDTEPQRIEAV